MKITEKIHLLKHEFVIPIAPDKKLPRFVYSIVVFGEKVALIDSGVKNSHEKIFDYIQKQGRKVNEVDTLILSHAHPDHIGSAKFIKDTTGCTVITHRNEQEWIENIDIQVKSRPVPGFYELVNESVKIDRCIEGNEKLIITNDITLQCIYTPGHSKGSFSIYFPQDKVLFTADAIPLEGDIPNYDNFRDLKKSIQLLKQFQEQDIMISSWTEPIYNKAQMNELIIKGEEYLDKLDASVKQHYRNNGNDDLDTCKKVITELGLPQVYINPIVHKSFISHFA